MAGHIATAKRTDWCTPANVVEAVHATFGGAPDLDPCSNARSILRARHEIRLPEDGLAADWTPYKSVYCNPPFGRGLDRWVLKCAEEEGSSTEIILLVPAAVDTAMWHDVIWRQATRICFFRGRLRFVGAPASAPMAMAAVYFGYHEPGFASAFRPLGRIVTP